MFVADWKWENSQMSVELVRALSVYAIRIFCEFLMQWTRPKFGWTLLTWCWLCTATPSRFYCPQAFGRATLGHIGRPLKYEMHVYTTGDAELLQRCRVIKLTYITGRQRTPTAAIIVPTGASCTVPGYNGHVQQEHRVGLYRRQDGAARIIRV